MAELKMPGNSITGSRAFLAFDKLFDSEPHLQLIKELLIQVTQPNLADDPKNSHQYIHARPSRRPRKTEKRRKLLTMFSPSRFKTTRSGSVIIKYVTTLWLPVVTHEGQINHHRSNKKIPHSRENYWR